MTMTRSAAKLITEMAPTSFSCGGAVSCSPNGAAFLLVCSCSYAGTQHDLVHCSTCFSLHRCSCSLLSAHMSCNVRLWISSGMPSASLPGHIVKWRPSRNPHHVHGSSSKQGQGCLTHAGQPGACHRHGGASIELWERL